MLCIFLISLASDDVFTAKSRGLESYNEARSPTKSRLLKNLNFMNPTASLLARQNCPLQIHCDRLLRRSQKLVKNEENRFQKLVRKEERSSRNSSMNGTQATKRQKLEAGYSCKVARLKHQALLLHKAPKKVGLLDVRTAFAKPKVTVPREPNLETALRAERHRSKINLESAENAKSNASTFRARPLNKKILEAPSCPLAKKSTPQLPEFQVFHLRTSERALQHASVNAANAPNSSPTQHNETISSRRVTPAAALKEKLEALDKFKARSLYKKECNFPNDKRFSNEPPIEAFSKLFLTSEDSNAIHRSKTPLHPKGSKENAPASFHPGHKMKNVAKSQWLCGKHFQCGSNRTVPSMVPQINRSLDIR
ncbi:protein TPX2 isoform X2 [Hevea brasiliensis]|uniref:protein TPX2 isoform X2 n=1 Tax=Hevea brasiliensis TaxID=3981 RepID=UPI0025F208E4|nr:protein TPX2 isoform X2 [Hevea brasiliensis]